jgi:hypothetical protein
MNSALKALINIIFDAEKLTVDAIGKSYFNLLGDSMALVGDVPGAVANWSDLMNEIKELSQAANEQDLLQYVEQKLSSIPALSGAKPAAVMAAVVQLIQAGYALEQAIVS